MHFGRMLGVPALIAAAAATLVFTSGSEQPPNVIRVSVRDRSVGPAVPAGFLGLSLEFEAVPGYAGTDPRAINPLFVQLVNNFNVGQAPQLRIGGDSSDRTWWPVPRMKQPGGVTYSLNPRWAQVTAALARELNARLVLGINMEANNRRLAAYEARQFVSRIPRRLIRALELGNEPELYGLFPWYQRNGHHFKGRPHNYSPADYTREFTQTAAALPRTRLAGPATGQPPWWAYLHTFVHRAPRLSLVTLHHYATRGCFVTPGTPQYHSIANLLTPFATRGLAASIAPYAHLGVPARLDELNSVNCGGVSGVSDRFASALWAVDVLFWLERSGYSGVNFHTFPGARYAPFTFTHTGGSWRASVRPLYYGILMFSQAAPPGSQLLAGSGPIRPGLDMWALRITYRRLHVVLVNYGRSVARTVALRLPGASGPATVERLRGPSVSAAKDVTLGGRGFGTHTSTGVLTGAPTLQSITPQGGRYTVAVPAASAALVTVAR